MRVREDHLIKFNSSGLIYGQWTLFTSYMRVCADRWSRGTYLCATCVGEMGARV